VGNGLHIRIWQDRWLPQPLILPVEGSTGELGSEATVSELIDWNGPTWKVGLIRELFGLSTAEVITQIPIGSISTNDQSTWGHTAQGEFTVRSAYHLQKAIIVNAEGESSGSDHVRDLWRHLWKLNIPHAVKVFMWRACSNALATKANLFRRKITEDPLCPMCGVQAETTGHILWGCSAAKAIWSECNSKIQKRSSEHEDFLDIFSDLLRVLDQDDLERVAVVARAMWFRRNAVVHGRQIGQPYIVVSQALENLEAFQQATSRSGKQMVSTTPSGNRWQAPPEGFVKINWDAAVDLVNCRMGIGIIARNSQGEVVASVSAPKSYIIAPDIAEAVAALRAVTFCRELASLELC
jgi:hypothetical protein